MAKHFENAIDKNANISSHKQEQYIE